MVSISSSKIIRERTRNFCNKIKNWNDFENTSEVFEKIKLHLQQEYELIPDKERIGKGSVFIARYVAKEIFQYLIKEVKLEEKYFIRFAEKLFIWGEKKGVREVQYLALFILSEFVESNPEQFDKTINIIEKCATHEEWVIRENAIHPIVAGLKKKHNLILTSLAKWAESDEKNLRRLVAESLRPKGEVKWLRDPSKNDVILKILTILRKDPSIYVRKSVGNNIKDLSKYMPEKTLDLMEKWITESKIKVRDDLASESGLNQDQQRLIWTMKHSMRWIKEKYPEFHSRLEKILGKNYILYYDEKGNRQAKPATII